MFRAEGIAQNGQSSHSRFHNRSVSLENPNNWLRDLIMNSAFDSDPRFRSIQRSDRPGTKSLLCASQVTVAKVVGRAEAERKFSRTNVASEVLRSRSRASERRRYIDI